VAGADQVVGEVHPADAVVDHPRVRREVHPGQPADHLDAEPVVAEEDVADTDHQHGHSGSTSSVPK
jgi:hypothetical protein